MEKPTKEGLLEKYRARDPKLFVQIDGFQIQDHEDNLMKPDDEGFWFQARTTYELMDRADVRILIDPQIHRKDASRMLKKMIDKIEHDWLQLLKETGDEWETSRGMEGIAESLIRLRGFELEDFEKLVQAAKERLEKRAVKSDDECPFW